MGQINLYTAVEEMKAVSKAEGTFSIKFRKYNRQKQSGGDLVFLKAARLRSARRRMPLSSFVRRSIFWHIRITRW